MIKNIILNFGHVESSQPFYWIFTRENGLDTRFEAAHSLAVDYLAAYFDDEYDGPDLAGNKQIKICCRINKEREDSYCRECGNNLSTYKDYFDIEAFEQWLYDNSKANMDESRVVQLFDEDSNWSFCDDDGKKFFDLKEKESLIIYNAERIIPFLLWEDTIPEPDSPGAIVLQAVSENIDYYKDTYEFSYDKFKKLINKNSSNLLYHNNSESYNK